MNISRIALGGISTESSTFTMHRTVESDFEVLRGRAVLDVYPLDELSAGTGPIEWIPLLRATAPPGGPMEPEYYDLLRGELLEGLRRATDDGPLDGLYLDLHGAMTVAGRQAAEEELLERVREVVGARTVIATSMDPHGNLSERYVELIDVATSHRHSPHIDNRETRERTLRLLLSVVRSGARPAKAWVRIPALLSGERTSTLSAPGRRVCLEALASALETHDVEDAAIWVGRAWADEERCAAGVLALGHDPDQALACAAELARTYWEARDDMVLVNPHNGDLAAAIDFVADGAPTPVIISDSGDNVTAGGSGDSTFVLHGIRRSERLGELSVLIAGLVDPESVAAAHAAGVGSILRRSIGATVDRRFGEAVAADWRVEKLIAAPDGRAIGALLRDGRISVTVQVSRAPFVSPDDPAFASGMLQDVVFVPTDAYQVVVVKNGYQFPSQDAIAGSSFLAITPGGSDLDFTRLDYRLRRRPMYPLDKDFEPDLTARLVSSFGS